MGAAVLHADDLMISAESMEELLVKVQTWRAKMEKKDLRVDMAQTKFMVSGINLNVLKKRTPMVSVCSVRLELEYVEMQSSVVAAR